MRALTMDELSYVSGGFAGLSSPPPEEGPETVVVPGTRVKPQLRGSNVMVIICNGGCGKLELPDYDAMVQQFIDAAVQNLCENVSEDAGAGVGTAVGYAAGYVAGAVGGTLVGGAVGAAIGTSVPGPGNLVGAVAIGSVGRKVASKWGAAAGAAAGLYLGKAAAAGATSIACNPSN